MKDLLLVDDDGEMLMSLARALSTLIAPLSLCGAGTHEQAKALLLKEQPKVVVLDLCLDDRRGVESGFALLDEIRNRSPHIRVIVLTGHGSLENGIKALNSGAASFVEKPVEPAHLAALIRDAVHQATMRLEFDRLKGERSADVLGELRGVSEASRVLRERIAFAASSGLPVLLLGETGVGKGLCARLIHESRRGSSGRFVHYQPNFGGGDLMQSELFGHAKGAFTGAAESRRGLVMEACGGTLFIDELDEIPAETQVRLLDLIQEKRIRALGADHYQSVDCRFIAATNRPIEEALELGKIRRDLYHRIAQCVVSVPALRERPDDIPILCEGILKDLSVKDALNVFAINEQVIAALRGHSWRGNVRELQGVVTNAAYHARFRGRSCIEVEDLPRTDSVAPAGSGPIGSFRDAVESFKASLVREALSRNAGNQVSAARELGLDRKTLRRLAQV